MSYIKELLCREPTLTPEFEQKRAAAGTGSGGRGGHAHVPHGQSSHWLNADTPRSEKCLQLIHAPCTLTASYSLCVTIHELASLLNPLNH